MNEPLPEDVADGIPLGDGERAPPRPSLRAMEIETLSPEARLATALVMQAQALEGMHQSHADLARRVGAEKLDGARVESALAAVHRHLEDLEEGQRSSATQLRALRRRSSRVLAGAAVLVAAALGLAGWLAAELGEVGGQTRALVEASAVSARRQHDALEAGLAVARSGSDEADELRRSVDALAERLDRAAEREQAGAVALAALQARHETAAARVEQLEGEVAQARDVARVQAAEAELLGGEVARLQGELDTARAQAKAMRDERNGQIGETARLRSQLLERELQVQQLQDTIAGLEQRWAATDKPAIETSTAPAADSLAESITAALASSGAATLAAVEVGGVRDGELRDVMLVERDAWGAVLRVLRAERAWITALAGAARLRLANGERGATGEWIGEFALPALDRGGWEALGVSVPTGVVADAAVRAALAELLEPAGYRIASFGGWNSGTLRDLVIEGEGRSIRAASASVERAGPALELRDGAVVTGEVERPFFHGAMRLPLPGADYDRWSAALVGAGS